MLEVALQFLKGQLDSYLFARTGSDVIKVTLSKVVGDDGRYAFAEEAIGASIINIEEERVVRAQVPEQTLVNGQTVTVPPPLRLNLYVLFVANFKIYGEALKYLAHVMTFFQGRTSFKRSEYPDLDPAIERLSPELQSLTFEQLNQIWAFIGGKYLPSIAYKVRLIALQDGAQVGVRPAVAAVDTKTHLA